MKEILGCLLAVCVITLKCNVEAESNAVQSIALAIAKGKEIIDRGVKIQSERQDSVDFFGTKVDTGYAVKQGFGDAVQEGSTDSFEEDLVRKKRTIDVVELLRPRGLFTNSASGANVNIVKINSVSNVYNYGPAPEATTAASRRRRSGKWYLKKSANKCMVPVLHKSWKSEYLSKSRMKPDGSLKTHTISQTVDSSNRGDVVGAKFVDKLNEEVPMRYKRSLSEVRLKRSPQEVDEDLTTEKPRCGGKGKGGRGGRHGRGRGRGPPPPPEDDNEQDTDEERKKREVKKSSQNDIQGYRGSSTSISSARSTSSSSSQYVSHSKPKSDSASKGSSSSSESSSSSDSDSNSDSGEESSEMKAPEPNSAAEVSYNPLTTESTRSKRSPCSGRRPQQGMTTMAPEVRAKRDVQSEVEELDEEHQKVHSWFNTVVETIVESAKRVSAAVRSVFGKDEQGNPDAESYDDSVRPNAETLE